MDEFVDTQETEKLIAAALLGDTAAFARLTQSHYRLVYALAYSTVGDWAAAQDITQDAFLVAWTHLGKLRGAGAFSMWIRKITRNLALNWIRSADYRRRLAERHERLVTPLLERPEDPAQALGREERRAALWHALEQLSPPVREAMVLFYLEGRSGAEAAGQLGISENAFKLRLHTGRARLRALFEKQVEDSLYSDLAPPDAKTAANRVLAGLAVGPALPELGNAVSGSGIGMWLHHVAHNGIGEIIVPVLKGGAIVNAKKLVVGAAIAVLFAGGAYWGLANRSFAPPQQGENWKRLAKDSHASWDENRIDAQSAGNTADAARKLAKGDKQTKTDSPEDVPTPTERSAPEEQFAASGDMTASAALLLSLEKGKIKDPKDYASVAGVVIDTHGSPIPDAMVQLFTTGVSDEPGNLVGVFSAWQNPAHKFTAMTDPSGRFIVQGVAYTGTATVTASADGYNLSRDARVRVSIKPGDRVSNVRLTLEPGKGLYGRLLAPDGSPVTDGVVNLMAYRARGDSMNGNLGTTNTDARGQFHLAFPREGAALLVTSSLTYGGASFDSIPVGTDDVIELQMPKGARLTGTISMASGGPAAGVLVFLIGKADDGHGQRRNVASVYAGKTDSSGHYTIDAIDANQSYVASIANPDQTPLSQPQPVPDLAPGETRTWDYTIQEMIYVRGRVAGERTGKPLSGVKVAALKDGEYVIHSDTPVQADGTYELRLSSGPGLYKIFPRLWRIEPEETGYEWGKDVQLSNAQEATVDLTFMDTVTMSVRVVDASGNPMKGMMLGIHEGDHTWAPLASTGADGRFAWSGFMPGLESNFVVLGEHETLGNTPPVIGEPGQVFPEETVVVYGSAGLEGTALKADGQPLANGVVVLRVYYALTRELERKVNTDASGHFLVEGQLPATAVMIEMDGYAESSSGVDKYTYASDEVELFDGQIRDLGNVRFSLRESGVNVDS